MADRDGGSARRAAESAGIPGSTSSERKLWEALRTRQPGWLTEFPTGRYRLDFFCPEASLAVEVDGGSHYGRDRAHYDERRDAWHLEQGIETFRVSHREVTTDLRGVLTMIDERVNQCLVRLGKPPVVPTQAPWPSGQRVPVRSAVPLPVYATGARPGRAHHKRRPALMTTLAVVIATVVATAVLVIATNWPVVRHDVGRWVQKHVHPPTSTSSSHAH